MLEFLSYRKPLGRGVWPKTPPTLSQDQLAAREKYMKLWHEELPRKYGMIEAFNHGFVAKLPPKPGIKTLEIGAGLGSHLQYEDLTLQEYHCLEYREEFCAEIRERLPPYQVWCGDIHSSNVWPPQSFDRIIAIHVLEHLRDLPLALDRIQSLLKKDGVLDIVIPCEGGLAHTLARKISAERLFREHFKMDFTPIHLNEHVNSFGEIMELLSQSFRVETRRYFPLRIPFPNFNLCAGFRLTRLR